MELGSFRPIMWRTLILFGIGGLLGMGINLVRGTPLPWVAEPRFSDLLETSPGDTPLPVISIDEIAPLLGQPDVVFVDIRAPGAYAAGHLPNAVSLPAARLAADPSRIRDFLFPPEWLVVLYGEGEDLEAARRVAQRFLESGITHLRWMSGGFAAWQARGFPVTREGEG
ncbi:MAG: rhodanese-like domain-containing protein [Deltaproteobacteria bacterium]|nr:MAG: rhodanese-like domain-containing protein [Deltaproteobacteria bacterium]